MVIYICTVQTIITTTILLVIIIIIILILIISCCLEVPKHPLVQVRPKDINDQARTMNLGMFDGTISAYSSGGINSTALSTALGSNYSTLFSGANTIQAMNRTQYPDINQFYLQQARQVGLYTYNKQVVIGAVFEPQAGTSAVDATAWYSGQPYHAMPVALAYLVNAFARQVSIGQLRG